MRSFIKTFAATACIGVLAPALAWLLATAFPSWEWSLYDWRVRLSQPAASSQSVMIIGVEDGSHVFCGEEEWDRRQLTKVITSLGQAGSAIIAPMMPYHSPVLPECGGAAAEAKLIEAIRQAGTVVLPVSLPSGLTDHAKALGHLRVEPDADGTVRRVHTTNSTSERNTISFGLAVAAALEEHTLSLPSDHGVLLVKFADRWDTRPFLYVSLQSLLNLIEQRKWNELSTLVQDKAVLLLPVTTETIQTPLESSLPEMLFHAHVLNAALTQSWLRESPLLLSVLMSILLATGSAWLTMSITGWRGFGWSGVLGLGYLGLSQGALTIFGVVLPIVVPLLALASAVCGAMGWRVFQIQHEAKSLAASLATMREELTHKESIAEQFEEELQVTQGAVMQSSERLQELSASEEEARMKFQEAQSQVEETRQRVQELESQMARMQKRTETVTNKKIVLTSAEQDKLGSECARFGILTQDSKTLQVFQNLKKAAPTLHPILLLGETGTGKEVFAKAAHELSPRAQGPFISVNMAAIRPELFESEFFGHAKGAFTGAVGRKGLLEAADGGTIFLDEIGELGLELQAKLLRVLEDGSFHRVGETLTSHVNVRVVAATNKDLGQVVREGGFREDLYYRLRGVVLRIPPLRERGQEDLKRLVQHLVGEFCQKNQREPLQLSQGAWESILTHTWPGNIRELRQSVAEAITLADDTLLTEKDLRFDRSQQGLSQHYEFPAPSLMNDRERLTQTEDEAVLACLRRYGFDMQTTARALEWDRSTITQRLKGIGFQALVHHKGDMQSAALTLAGDPSLARTVEIKLREYKKNLIPSHKHYTSPEEAIADCRKRLKNLPERHFPAVEELIRQHFASHVP